MMMNSSIFDWDRLPLELKAKVVEHLDLLTSLKLAECRSHERLLVKQFTKHITNLVLKFGVAFGLKNPEMVIELRDEINGTKLTWRIDDLGEKGCLVLFTNQTTTASMIRHQQLAEVTSKILRRILSTRFTHVKSLELNLNEFNSRFELPLSDICIEILTLNSCSNHLPLLSLLENENIFIRQVHYCTELDELVHDDARHCLYEESALFLKPVIQPWMELTALVTCLDEPITTFKEASSFVDHFLLDTVALQHMFQREEVKIRVKSRNAIDTIMIFIHVFYQGERDKATYLLENDDIEEKIMFWKEDFDLLALDREQLSTLIMFFILSVIGDKPEVLMVIDDIGKCLKMMLKKYERYGYYDKLVEKVEKFVSQTQFDQ